jgi:hypothetical protein
MMTDFIDKEVFGEISGESNEEYPTRSTADSNEIKGLVIQEKTCNRDLVV